MTWDELVFRPLTADPFIYKGTGDVDPVEEPGGGGTVFRPDVREAVESDLGAIQFKLNEGFSELGLGGDGDSLVGYERAMRSYGSKGDTIELCKCGDKYIPCSTLDGCSGTTMDARLNKPREMIIWLPRQCNSSEMFAIVKKDYCFTKICFSALDFTSALRAIDAGWNIQDIVLNLDCCNTCDHHVCEDCNHSPNDPNPSNWDSLSREGQDDWRQFFLQICDSAGSTIPISISRDDFIDYMYQRNHKFTNINDRMGIFYDKVRAGEIDCEFDCPNPSPNSLESMIKIAKTRMYNRDHDPDKTVDEMSEEDFKSIPGFYNYFIDEPGVSKTFRCRPFGTGRLKCNYGDLVEFISYTRSLDDKYNNGQTAVTIGDYRFSRHSADESEGGFDMYRPIADGLSYGGPSGRAKNVGAGILTLSTIFDDDDIKSDDQRYAWSLLANMVNQDGPISQEFSYPWIYSPDTEAGSDSGEYNDLMGHAMNEQFHTVAYFGLEFKGTCNELIKELAKFRAAAVCSGWLKGKTT